MVYLLQRLLYNFYTFQFQSLGWITIVIRLSTVSKSFDNNRTFIVKDVSFTIEKGEILVLLGSSGAGKSTVLKMINRLIPLSSGDIEVDGCSIKTCDPIKLRRNLGYVFQNIGLFPHLTVAENISIALRLTKQSKIKQNLRAHELLELVGLQSGQFATRYPAELSGGQQQRVGVARALASDPDYLLMDEPFGALDAITRADLQQEIWRLKKELNKTILFVTHDIFEALHLADRLAVMHQGRLEQIGLKEELINKPSTPFVQNLLHNTAQQIHEFAKYFNQQDFTHE